MGQFMAKMEEKAANTIKNADKIKNKLGGLRTSKSDNIADYELKMTLTKKTPQVIYFIFSIPFITFFTVITGNAKD
jgi:hypothetical protein